MTDWIRVAPAADIAPGDYASAEVDGNFVAVFNVDGEFFALDGVCPHQGGPLGKGALQGCIVTCPWHGWQFDVRNGEFQLRTSLVQPGFAVRIVGEEVQVEVEA